MKIEAKIEAILFWKGEPMSRKKLSEILSSSAEASEGQGKPEDVFVEESKINLPVMKVVAEEPKEEKKPEEDKKS